MEKKYGLVTSAFLLTGGDGYDVLSEHAEDVIPYGKYIFYAISSFRANKIGQEILKLYIYIHVVQ